MHELLNIDSERDPPPPQPLGGHTYVLADGEGPDGGDVVHFYVNGELLLEDIKLVLGLLGNLADRHQHAFMIVHIVGTGGFSPEARRYYIHWRKEQRGRNRWVYVVGTSILVRTLIALVVRGTKLLTGAEPSIFAVETAAEAGTHIAAVRRRFYR